ncbi:MAG TPA: hypothetical protein VGP31_09265 [Planosporangium sp.]|jgi:hypothetical protein|nr:hypothetical protein [Planosporangium sp.]
MDQTEIARIIKAHRPRLYWFGCAVAYGCVCGSFTYPCGAMLSMYARLEFERAVRANRGRFRT